MPDYDYLIVGAGLFGSTFAYQMTKQGKRCLVIDQRSHTGGNCHTSNQDGIIVHDYGAHIFHTSNQRVWDFVNQFGEFNHYINQPIAMVEGVPYNMPFNMNMFSRVFGVTKPSEAFDIIEEETKPYQTLVPKSLEDQALQMVGKTIFEKFIRGYSEKQWGSPCSDLPASFIKRLPLRFTYDNNYYDDTYQGIPIDGYSGLFDRMLRGIEVEVNVKYNEVKSHIEAKKTIYTGMIDEFFDFQFGSPEYRSLHFVHLYKDCYNYQGCAVINYPGLDVPYTRSIEHKHFALDTTSPTTIVTYEFPVPYKEGLIPYYPVGNSRDVKIYDKYLTLASQMSNIVFAGRLGSYQYYDMDDTIDHALQLADKELQ